MARNVCIYACLILVLGPRIIMIIIKKQYNNNKIICDYRRRPFHTEIHIILYFLFGLVSDDNYSSWPLYAAENITYSRSCENITRYVYTPIHTQLLLSPCYCNTTCRRWRPIQVCTRVRMYVYEINRRDVCRIRVYTPVVIHILSHSNVHTHVYTLRGTTLKANI